MRRFLPTCQVILASTALLLAATLANASTVVFNNTANSQLRGGAYAGLYSLTVDGQAILAFCDDRYTNVASNWTANILSYADIQSGGVGKFNDPSTPATLAKYSQAGYLMSLLPGTSYTQQADINEAIWKIMTPGYALVGAGAAAYYLSATDGSHDGFDWSGVMRVITAVPPTSSQEYLSPIVPIPAAAWMFAPALALLGWLRRRPPG